MHLGCLPNACAAYGLSGNAGNVVDSWLKRPSLDFIAGKPAISATQINRYTILHKAVCIYFDS